MKLTKAQIQQIIKEELEALDESPFGVGSTRATSADMGNVRGGDSAAGAIGKVASPEEIERRRQEDERVAANVRAADVEAMKKFKIYKAAEAERQAAKKKLVDDSFKISNSSNPIFSMMKRPKAIAQAMPRLIQNAEKYGNAAKEEGEIILDAMKASPYNDAELAKSARNYLGDEFGMDSAGVFEKPTVRVGRPLLYNPDSKRYEKQGDHKVQGYGGDAGKMIISVARSYEMLQDTDIDIKLYRQAAGAAGKLKPLASELMKLRNAIKSELGELKKKPGGAIGAAFRKLKGFVGLEEKLTLTAEELQRIINEELENITKGN